MANGQAHWQAWTAADGMPCRAYLAQPAGQPHAAVVVLQEIFGVNAHIRDVTERWAAEGFLAIAPALFTRVAPDVQLGYGAPDIQQGRTLKATAEALGAPGVLREVQAAMERARALVPPGGRVGVIGFCWGGLVAWRAACQLPGLHAAVCYYGGGMTVEPEASRQPRCPVLAHFGRLDAIIAPHTVETFAAAQPGAAVHLYEADHGFHCDQRASHDPASARLAHGRTQQFFTRHLCHEQHL